MVLKCIHGHVIKDGKNTCEEGHDARVEDQAAADAGPPVVLSQAQFQQLLQSITSPRANQENPRPYVKKPEPPTIGLNSNENQWAFFMDEWDEFKRRCKLLTPDDIRSELRAACSEDLRRELFDFVGGKTLKTISETDLLKKIKTLAVKGSNKAVHRKQFYAMLQDQGQPVQAYVAKLRGKADHCQFVLKCSSEACNHQVNSYAESMVEDQMVTGCADPDIQEEVLAKDAQLTSFQAKFDLIQALEEGKHAKKQLSTESTLAAHKSQYQKQRWQKKVPLQNIQPQENVQVGCSGCGSKLHGKGTPLPRRIHCPEINTRCDFCKITGHCSDACRKKESAKSYKSQQDSQHNTIHGDNEMDLTSCFFTYTRDVDIPTRHMEWSETAGSFVNNCPKALPQLQVSVSVMASAHRDFGREIPDLELHKIRNQTRITCCTDTGAQTCASSPDILRTLNVREKYLIPTSHKIVGVTKSPMDILGVLLLRIEVQNRVTHQVVYVSKNISGFFLSRSAQTDLGILPDSYPASNSFASQQPPTTGSHSESVDQQTCNCPRRTAPPPIPEKLPYPPTSDNREKLEQWLLNYYGASVFNTCDHQPLPKMTGEPLSIHFREDATPKAFHNPIPVPNHWKKKVKADLDRDVRLGIIEPVPPGTPTLWCAKMVVVPKKDQTPRRTVDLQPLNAATYRQTHHTPSPFHQASMVPPHTKKTVLDAWNGYHSLPLSEDARDATTFLTEWGRYRYLSAPQGFHAAGDAYTKCFDDITMDFPRKSKCIDDTILWDDSIEDAFWHTIDYLTLCGKNGIIFNPSKFHFSKDEVDFTGFTLTPTGIKPTTEMLAAIREFPTPKDITGVRSWFGLVNQVAYTFSMTNEMLPFREMLKPGNKWYWDETLAGPA